MGANLDRADVKYANLSRASLQRARLSHMRGALADFSCTNLNGADLSDARLERVNLSDANVAAGNLSHAELRHTNLSGTVFEKITVRTESVDQHPTEEDFFPRLTQTQLDEAQADPDNPPRIGRDVVDAETGKPACLVWQIAREREIEPPMVDYLKGVELLERGLPRAVMV